MSTTKKVLALLLALALMLSLAACGGSAGSSAPAASASEAAESAPEADAAPAEDAEDAEDAESAAPAEIAEPEAAAPNTMELPLTDEVVTFSILGLSNPNMNSYGDPSEYNIFKRLKERTNIDFEWTMDTMFTITETHSLLVAANDLPEIVGGNFYVGGVASAIDEEVYWDLAPYLEEFAPDYYNRPLDEPRFLRELREDILPLLIDKYSTYASDASPESISAVRQHFGFAGLSMGSIYAYTAVIPDSLDLFGWFGCFSGSDGYMDQLSARLNAEPDRDYPIYYFYNSIGTRDPYYYLHKSQYQDLVELTDGLTEGKNAAFTEVQGAGHEYYAWSTGLYNFLQIAFSLPE